MTENTSVPRSFVLGMMTGIGMCWLLVAVIVEFTKPPTPTPTVVIPRYGYIKAGACNVRINSDGVGLYIFDCNNGEVAAELRRIGVGFSEDEILSYETKDVGISNQKYGWVVEDYPPTWMVKR